MTAGYSGTPLSRKLGLKDHTQLLVLGAPAGFDDWLGPLPAGLVRQRRLTATTNLVHVFVTERAELTQHLVRLRASLRTDAAIWVSWPKKSSKVPTDVTEDTIRAVALPLGLVDIKVCAVNEVWSGLKLAVRQSLRGTPPPA